MISIVIIIIVFITIFVGYTIGRISHILWGHWNTPHHWVYGLICIAIGLVFYENILGKFVFYFGIGHFLSDIKDFLIFKFFGRDSDGPKRFWGFD